MSIVATTQAIAKDVAVEFDLAEFTGVSDSALELLVTYPTLDLSQLGLYFVEGASGVPTDIQIWGSVSVDAVPVPLIFLSDLLAGKKKSVLSYSQLPQAFFDVRALDNLQFYAQAINSASTISVCALGWRGRI